MQSLTIVVVNPSAVTIRDWITLAASAFGFGSIVLTLLEHLI